MTLATNDPLYVKGNYNADGTVSTATSTTSARYPDDWNSTSRTSATEPPAALAGDAITLLSNTWNDANSGAAIGSRTPTGNLEISAAFLTGNVPSAGTTYSGGVENFPRFLENWDNSSTTVAIRGSMVCLFKSSKATEGWPGTGTVYNAPKRLWGFNELFRTGVYPPGTPVSRTFRRIHYRTLDVTAYEAAVGSLR
jgi:hypothetical protein